ncbi:hypothetical protein FHETE_10346 [Fusarium heterosporum]|uniref:Uncharacterized protein n=1 Tax=Fusarium heterosporum TaxID=42747 RepID=A0A8H5WCP3_FUSHE|nr:hypothetical protein FHETE_10346 [Fusarium heterosporum]
MFSTSWDDDCVWAGEKNWQGGEKWRTSTFTGEGPGDELVDRHAEQLRVGEVGLVDVVGVACAAGIEGTTLDRDVSPLVPEYLGRNPVSILFHLALRLERKRTYLRLRICVRISSVGGACGGGGGGGDYEKGEYQMERDEAMLWPLTIEQ